MLTLNEVWKLVFQDRKRHDSEKLDGVGSMLQVWADHKMVKHESGRRTLTTRRLSGVEDQICWSLES